MKKTVYTSAVILVLLAACSPLKQHVRQVEKSKRYHSITPGAIWLNTDGKPIQAHGFSVFYKDGTYYWYGENKEFTTQGSNIWTYGIRCYTSKDFYNWQDRGFIIPPDMTNIYSPLNPSQWIDRPHIIYCPKTGKYVAWIKILGGDDGQFMTVLQADNFVGPYKIIRKGFRPNGFESGDFDLYVDEKTGQGYIWFERPHYEMICATLTDDFTSVTENYSVHFSGKLPPATREAPTHFMRNGKHYLFTSGTSGFSPNQSLVSMFSDYHGAYTDLGNPHPADTSHTSYCSQITDVIKIPGKKDLYVALADRWMPETCGTNIPRQEEDKIRERYKSLKPRERNSKEVALTDMRNIRRTDWDVTTKATYVWLPITWENGVPKIYWKEAWKLEDFK
ncbi:MAG: glycoside hydrolase [Ferruginibacter sp.]|uniref:family 43 glycosylhydrolase n=1 Tax=Ferruginibacter sp. TaxID=1940288 RepID=UPI002659BD4D|nr:family 43 glycosylhydrolase [Ferruginibacter sp.]MDB5279622.1 glycoside hydrolase [Ferruginibacter sp.]